jgi:hypothetical protein
VEHEQAVAQSIENPDRPVGADVEPGRPVAAGRIRAACEADVFGLRDDCIRSSRVTEPLRADTDALELADDPDPLRSDLYRSVVIPDDGVVEELRALRE